jgi:hypothetical protein
MTATAIEAVYVHGHEERIDPKPQLETPQRISH